MSTEKDREVRVDEAEAWRESCRAWLAEYGKRESDVDQSVSTKGASQTQGHVPKREPGKGTTE